MAKERPYKSKDELLLQAEKIWFSLSESDWLEAFAAHPKIGDISSLQKKFQATASTAANEQSGVNTANTETLKEFARLNQEYEAKFGFIFIVFATGKSAQEMLDLLKARIHNSREQELKSAAREQSKITRLRLEKKL